MLHSDWRDWESYVDFQQEKLTCPTPRFLYYITAVRSCWLAWCFCRLGITAEALVVLLGAGCESLACGRQRASWEKEAGGSIYGHAGVCGQHPTRPSAVPVQARCCWLGVVVIKHAAARWRVAAGRGGSCELSS